MKPSVLVSGSSGYIGSHFAKYFKKKNWTVCGVDRVASPERVQPFLDDFVRAEIADRSSVLDLCRKNNVEAVVHCAALCLVGESVQKPKLYWKNNVEDGAAFVDALEEAGVRNLLFSSTAATYGEPQEVPIPETHPQKPINPYGETKRVFEKDLLSREEKGRMRIGIFRYFNAAGADPEGDLGEVHDPETHLIPNAILALLGKNSKMSLFGKDFPTRDGTCERDYIHVWDLAQAHFLLMKRMIEEGRGGIYNLGTGSGYTVKEVLDEIAQQAGQEVPHEIVGRRPGDPAVLVADSRKAKKELGWTPERSDLSQIVKDALYWHRKREGLA